MILSRLWRSLTGDDKALAAALIAAAAGVAAAAGAAGVAAADNRKNVLIFTLIPSIFVFSLFKFSYFYLAYPFWFIVPLALIFLTEIFYWFDKDRFNGGRWYWFVLKKKASSFVDGLAVFITANMVRFGIINIHPNWSVILKWTGYIGAGLIALAIIFGVVYGYLWLNWLKYRKGNVRKKK